MTRYRADAIPRQVLSALEEGGLLHGRLLVALSGGVDSVVLLHAVAALRRSHPFALGAVHVHHGLSPNADAWSEACAALCHELSVPLTVARVQVRRARAESLEAAARAARYEVFSAQQADALLLAHHADDQAETVLLQLLRGAGVLGLAAMPPIRVLATATGLRLVRPLLRCSRATIERYASSRRLSWVEDESNRNLDLDRNYLRRQLLPQLSLRFPGCRETLARAAQNLSEAQQLLDQLAEEDAAGGVGEGRLSLATLSALDPVRQRNLLRWFLRANGIAPPARERLSDVLRQMQMTRSDAHPRIEVGGRALRRFRGWLLLEPSAPAAARIWTLAWKGAPRLALPGGGQLVFAAAEGAGLSRARLEAAPVTVRSRSGRERLRLAAGRPSRSLKNLLQEAGIPAWKRPALPLLFVGEALAWAAGVGCDYRFRAQAGEAGVLVEWREAAPQTASG
jgi:tRNA(Ile)-lysidine synthase